MKRKIIKDLYCFQCSLQFEKKSIYDMHLSIIHKYKKRTESFLIEIKSEPEEMELPLESNDIPANLIEEQDLNTISLKQNILQQEKEIIKCKICDTIFAKKANLNLLLFTNVKNLLNTTIVKQIFLRKPI